jgi:hypothetical protein
MLRHGNAVSDYSVTQRGSVADEFPSRSVEIMYFQFVQGFNQWVSVSIEESPGFYNRP